MTGLDAPSEWTGPSGDPNDEQFGDVVDTTTLEGIDEYDAVLVGEPYDGGVIGRKGARQGPAALREELAAAKTHHFEAEPIPTIADLGDLQMPEEEDTGAVQNAVHDITMQVHAKEALPVFLGGDNSLTFPNAAPLLDDGSVGALSFDAHLDCREVRTGPTSGTPYRQLHEEGLDRLVVVGARHFETSSTYDDYLRTRGGTVLTAEAVGAGPMAAVERALEELDDVDSVYVSVDLDVLDTPSAPGVSAPTPGGVTTRELYQMLRRVAGADSVAGFEVVECAPPLESGDRTATAGARAIAHFLAGYGGERS